MRAAKAGKAKRLARAFALAKAKKRAKATRRKVAGAFGRNASIPTLCTFGATFAAATVYVRLISKPAHQLDAGLRQISDGNYDTRIEPPPFGPMREAAVQFNSMADALSTKARLQDDFLFNVSHEFKTPLSYIQGFATLLQNDDLPDEERRDYLKSIATGTHRLSNMVSSLLELTIASNPQNEIEMSDFSLDEQLRHAFAMFVPLMDQRGIDYDTDLQDVVVCGNETLLGEVWANILSNAVKFTKEGDSIGIGLHKVEDRAVVSIYDTGIGMSEELLAHAFERFYHSDSKDHEGTGLGLAIAKAIVESHGGTIELASALDVGTTCTVALPLKP